MIAMVVPRSPLTRIWRTNKRSSHRFFTDICAAYHPSPCGVRSKVHSPKGFSAFARVARSRQLHQKAIAPGTAKNIGHRKSNHHFHSVIVHPGVENTDYSTGWMGFAMRRMAA